MLREKASTVFGPSGFERKNADPVGKEGGGAGVGVGVGVGVAGIVGWDFDFLESDSFLQAVPEMSKASVRAIRRNLSIKNRAKI